MKNINEYLECGNDFCYHFFNRDGKNLFLSVLFVFTKRLLCRVRGLFL